MQCSADANHVALPAHVTTVVLGACRLKLHVSVQHDLPCLQLNPEAKEFRLPGANLACTPDASLLPSIATVASTEVTSGSSSGQPMSHGNSSSTSAIGCTVPALDSATSGTGLQGSVQGGTWTETRSQACVGSFVGGGIDVGDTSGLSEVQQQQVGGAINRNGVSTAGIITANDLGWAGSNGSHAVSAGISPSTTEPNHMVVEPFSSIEAASIMSQSRASSEAFHTISTTSSVTSKSQQLPNDHQLEVVFLVGCDAQLLLQTYRNPQAPV